MFGTAHPAHVLIGFAEVMTRSWPWGPTDLKTLFQWPERYAKTLLGDVQRRELFRNLCKYNIKIFDSYSGMGTGAWTLHIAHKHMVRLRLNIFVHFASSHENHMSSDDVNVGFIFFKGFDEF